MKTDFAHNFFKNMKNSKSFTLKSSFNLEDQEQKTFKFPQFSRIKQILEKNAKLRKNMKSCVKHKNAGEQVVKQTQYVPNKEIIREHFSTH